MATCFYVEYEEALEVNPSKGDIEVQGTNGAVSCEGCFVDMSAKVTIGFHYLYNADADGACWDCDGTEEFSDYEVKVHAGGDFDYALDFSMDTPDFDLGTDAYTTTTMPVTGPLGPFSVYTGVDVTVTPSGELGTKGRIQATAGSFTATGSLDTDLEAWGQYEKDDAELTTGGDLLCGKLPSIRGPVSVIAQATWL